METRTALVALRKENPLFNGIPLQGASSADV